MEAKEAIELLNELSNNLAVLAYGNHDEAEVEALGVGIAAIRELSLIKGALAKTDYVAELNSFASAMWDWHNGDDSSLKRLALDGEMTMPPEEP